MKLSCITCGVAVVFSLWEHASGQGFVNLGFEDTTLTVFVRNPSIPSYATNATIPGWDWSPHSNAGYGDPNTTVAFNEVTLDAPAVTLHGTNSPYAPSLAGDFSILLQGGSQFTPPQFGGASVFQTGEIPNTARSLQYLGQGAFQVTFNGQSLTSFVLESAPNYADR